MNISFRVSSISNNSQGRSHRHHLSPSSECLPHGSPRVLGALGVVVVEVLDRKAGVLDVVADGPREVAPAHQPFVQRLEPLLPTRRALASGAWPCWTKREARHQA